MVAVITSISPAGHGIFKQIPTTSHNLAQNSRFRGLSGMAKPLKKSAVAGSHPPDQSGEVSSSRPDPDTQDHVISVRLLRCCRLHGLGQHFRVRPTNEQDCRCISRCLASP